MSALLAKMSRNAIQPLQPTPAEEPEPAMVPAPEPEAPTAVKGRGRKRKEAEAVSRPATPARGARAEDFEAYRTRFLTRAKEEEMGGLRVQLSRRNSRDLKFIAGCTGVTLTTLLNNVLRQHIESHANLLKTLTRSALSWEERDKDDEHEQ